MWYFESLCWYASNGFSPVEADIGWENISVDHKRRVYVPTSKSSGNCGTHIECTSRAEWVPASMMEEGKSKTLQIEFTPRRITALNSWTACVLTENLSLSALLSWQRIDYNNKHSQQIILLSANLLSVLFSYEFDVPLILNVDLTVWIQCRFPLAIFIITTSKNRAVQQIQTW